MIAAKAILIITILALACECSPAQPRFSFHEETRYELSSGEQGRLEIAIKDTTLRRGEWSVVDYTFFNTNGSYWIYNWQFISLIPLPGQLALYDSEKHYVGDLIQWEGGSRKGVGDDDWLFLYGASRVGKGIRFKVGYVPLTQYGIGRLLAPGKYFIQLILYKAFFSTNPSQIIGEPKPNFYDTAEGIRSNVLAVDLVD